MINLFLDQKYLIMRATEMKQIALSWSCDLNNLAYLRHSAPFESHVTSLSFNYFKQILQIYNITFLI